MLEEKVGLLLRNKNMWLTVAESCTGGLVGHRVTNIPGSSDYYLGSVTAYAYEVKESLLGVSHKTLQKYGAVSRETVLEMASGVRRALSGGFPLARVIGVSVSGIAGPGGGLPENLWAPCGWASAPLMAPGHGDFSGTATAFKTRRNLPRQPCSWFVTTWKGIFPLNRKVFPFLHNQKVENSHGKQEKDPHFDSGCGLWTSQRSPGNRKCPAGTLQRVHHHRNRQSFG